MPIFFFSVSSWERAKPEAEPSQRGDAPGEHPWTGSPGLVTMGPIWVIKRAMYLGGDHPGAPGPGMLRIQDASDPGMLLVRCSWSRDAPGSGMLRIQDAAAPAMLWVRGCSRRSSCGRRHRGGDGGGARPHSPPRSHKTGAGSGSAPHAPRQPRRTGLTPSRSSPGHPNLSRAGPGGM